MNITVADLLRLRRNVIEFKLIAVRISIFSGHEIDLSNSNRNSPPLITGFNFGEAPVLRVRLDRCCTFGSIGGAQMALSRAEGVPGGWKFRELHVLTV